MKPNALLILLFLFATACSAESPENPPAASPTQVEVSPTPSPSPTLAAPVTVRFVVKGDWGAGTSEQRAVTQAMCAMREQQPFTFVVTTGDNFYPSGTARRDTYDEPEACLLGYAGHEWRAAWGNHDVRGNSTSDILGTPSRYYAFDGPNIVFIVLDSTRAGDREQISWLVSRLQEAAGRAIVVAFHHPPFTSGSRYEGDSTIQRNWVPLFERHGVDLVLNGHSHAYEHSVVQGINYVVSGGGGASLYPCGDPEPGLVTCRSVHHFLMVEIEERSIRVTAVDQQGAVVDHFEFQAT